MGVAVVGALVAAGLWFAPSVAARSREGPAISQAAAPVDCLAYVTNYSDDLVSVIDTITNAVAATIDFPDGTGPWGVAVHPNGETVYVTANGDNELLVISVATNTVIDTIGVGDIPNGIAVSPDGTRAYITNFLTGSVAVADTATNAVTTTIDVDGSPLWVAFGPCGTPPPPPPPTTPSTVAPAPGPVVPRFTS